MELEYLKKGLESNMIGKSLETFLSTGNIKSRTGLDLMQDKGFCVMQTDSITCASSPISEPSTVVPTSQK